MRHSREMKGHTARAPVLRPSPPETEIATCERWLGDLQPVRTPL
jgi:hypothetical protein